MKIFFVGDFKSNTGPAIANMQIKKGLSDIKDIEFSNANNLITRVLEIIVNAIKCEKICICSFSKINYIVIKLAKIFRKDVFYIMHGYPSYEDSINNITDKKKNNKLIKLEKYIIKNSKKVFCVSKKFMEFMIEKEPEYSYKFDYNYNGIDIDEITKKTSFYKSKKKKNQIVSIGGGMRRKNNLTICKAIDILNSGHGLDLKYIVIGLPYTKKNEICKYDFVEYYDHLSHDKVLQILAKSHLYVQNSIFETFGLAIVEALLSGCNILISNIVGVIDLINEIEEKNIIYDTNNADEIAEKIKFILENDNCNIGYRSIQVDTISYEVTSKMLYKKILSYRW